MLGDMGRTASGPRAVSMGRVRPEALTGWEAWAGSSLR